MLQTSFTALISLLMLSYSINAQPGIAPMNPPALDLKEAPISGEAQRPLIADPCNNVNIAQNLDTSTSVTADKAGTFPLSAINLNSGADDSRSIEKVQVDTSGTGKDFVAAQVVPANDDTQQLTIQLPAGTKCTGGINQNLCLASITMTSGLRNCIVVSQVVDTVDPARPPLNTSQATDVRTSGVGERKRVKRSTPADEEKPEPASARGDQTSPRKESKLKKDKKKEKKAKGMNHNQRITGKRLWSSRLSQLAKLST